MSKMKQVFQFAKHPKLGCNISKNIFLFSHMRGNTSLLSHLIGSNSQVAGYYEQHINYRSKLDLLRLRLKYTSEHTIEGTPKYFFDKLLHNNNSVTKNILKESKNIICIRNPVSSINSITSLYSKNNLSHPYSSFHFATSYYLERLVFLDELSKKIDFLFVDADKLTSKPSAVLKSISSYLELDEPLKETYTVNALTGKKGAGDSSNNLQAGRIVKADKKDNLKPIDSEILDSINQIIARVSKRSVHYEK